MWTPTYLKDVYDLSSALSWILVIFSPRRVRVGGAERLFGG